MNSTLTIPICVGNLLHFSFDMECISFLISKGLGIVIVVMSCILKLPQIISMIKSKSTKGLTYISIYSDIITFLFACLYSYHMQYPFVTYGENLTVLIQNVIILLLCWKYDLDQSSDKKNMSFMVVTTIVSYVCMKDLYLNEYAWYMIGSSGIVFSSISRFSQIYTAYTEKTTGPLSSITFLLNIAGNISRIFTTIKETQDYLLVFSYVYSTVLNLIVLIQIIYYKKGDKVTDETISKDAKKKAI